LVEIFVDHNNRGAGLGIVIMDGRSNSRSPPAIPAIEAMRDSGLLLFTVFVLSIAATPAAVCAAEPKAPVDFARDVYPILQRACFECHGPGKQEGDLRLDERAAAFTSGSGSAIVPGKPEESEVLRRIGLPKGHDEIMPARGEPLAKRQVQIVRRWIAEGAVWPQNLQMGKHWAYVKPVRPQVPKVKGNAWPQSPIDHFVLQRLEEEGLKPSSRADYATLIRRLSLDLIGLPPSPEQVEAFHQSAIRNPQSAISTLVDDLLASPQFGERWARPWLDLARYADSHGFQRDDLRELWAYRDWVIRALNADLPFDRFTLEQVAGDLLPDADENTRIATGFHRCTTTNVEAGSEPEETRINQVIDRVNTTGAIWLGTTLECCQCHDHKYDPFTQKDYYGLLAFLNNTQIEADRSNPNVPGSIRFLGPTMPLNGMSESAAQVALAARIEELQKNLKQRRRELNRDLAEWEERLAKGLSHAAQTHVLEVAEFVSEEGAPHKLLEDGSVLLVDDAPATDTYVVTVHTKLTGISGIKLEALTDPSLPGKGPGRGDEKRPNFVLNTFRMMVASGESSAKPQAAGAPQKGGQAHFAPKAPQNEPVPVRLAARGASFSQKGFSPAGAVDEDPKSAWAINPKFGEPHWATFATPGPIGFDGGTTLTFTLVQQFGGGRTIGRLRLSAITGDASSEILPADIVKLLQTPAKDRSAAQKNRLLDYRLEQDADSQEMRDELAELQKEKQPPPVTTLVMQELPEPRMSAIFQRGDYRSPGEAVQPAAPAVLHALPEGPPNRIALARWLVHRDNPLSARVTVNRWWAELFGRGIVSTVEDFGIKGEPPTHPELLDWLAVEFMESGWSMKHVLRTIVLSATYQQASRVSPELLARDDQNLLLARGPRFRLDAEMIRDNALAAAGLLSLKQFGPPVRPYQPDGLWTKVGGAPLTYEVSPGEDRHRRGIYVVWKRASPYPSFVNFDATARLACTVKRSRSNTPLQALTLLNDPVYVEAAFALARRTLVERPEATLDEQLEHIFRLCLARTPSSTELAILHKLHDDQARALQDKPDAVKQLLANQAVPEGCSPAEFAAWHAVATVLLNLDETITKN
jgi:hypothetical protein